MALTMSGEQWKNRINFGLSILIGGDMEIKGTGSCQNSPKNQKVEEALTAVFEKDRGALTDLLEPEVEIQILFSDEVINKKNGIESIMEMDFPFDSGEIDSAISHGKFGAAKGKLWSKAKRYRFSFHCTFTNLKAEKVKEILIMIGKLDH